LRRYRIACRAEASPAADWSDAMEEAGPGRDRYRDPSVAAAEVEPLRLREPIEREDGEIAVESFGRFAVDAARVRH